MHGRQLGTDGRRCRCAGAPCWRVLGPKLCTFFPGAPPRLNTLVLTLVLLLAVVLSDYVARLLPLPVPRPVIQVALGAAIGLWQPLVLSLDPEVFFLLFLAPLLFLDGWRTAPEQLIQDKGTVIQLALGLVVFTVLGVGLFIHTLIPALPLPVALALAAVLSPTDPIAVSAIARRVPMPRRMMHILEGESLLNDATGLVCFRLAVAAALTGTFSLPLALLDFAWVAASGIAVGVALSWTVLTLKERAARRLGQDSGSQILISLLIPFGCYGLAEAVHGSGILAAVAAGLTMSAVESAGHAPAITRIRRNTVWDAIRFTANGVIFVILGEQLHGIVAGATASAQLTGHANPWWLLGYVMAISLALALLRLAWVLVSLQVGLFRRGPPMGPRADGQLHPPQHPGWRLVCVMSLAGVRGAVTLAGVLSLPLVLPGGAPLPGRDLAILLAMGVITVSLLAASIGLPLLLQGLEPPTDAGRDAEEADARIGAAQAAIVEVARQHQLRTDAPADAELATAAAARVTALYQTRIDRRAGDDADVAQAVRGEAVERELRIAGLRAERHEIYRELRARRLSSETAHKLIHEIDLQEARFGQ